MNIAASIYTGGTFNPPSVLCLSGGEERTQAAVDHEDPPDRIRADSAKDGCQVERRSVETEDGQVVSYSLAYINHRICGVDNGRVLGYDNSHEYHHRHFMGTVEPIEFENYKFLLARFETEVNELWKEEERK